ncbi:phage-like protein [Salmonella enterica]|nr:DUF2513 domain-containing protein [Salmonella enterica subsp. enterica serovar Treforest]EJI7099585.1 DUF2513 domain-containing protein [Salmonella enterica]SUF82943.1 phage-like protein [Salmonella enterica]HAK7806039.1 DUF2513 domain-containing protein [Salmonella enterica]HAK8777366.1 DUF2513 domain-containing protein [Salmonella enterica]
MKIDYDYLKEVLSAFLNSDKPSITIRDLGFYEKNQEDLSKLIFHLTLLVDQGLIRDKGLKYCTFVDITGISFSGDGIPHGGECDMVLTSEGHDFANALNQKPVLERIKKELSDAPFSVVKQLSSSWLTKIFTDKLGLE